jgi:hypothetical protein
MLTISGRVSHIVAVEAVPPALREGRPGVVTIEEVVR